MPGAAVREREPKDITVVDVETMQKVMHSVGWAEPYVLYSGISGARGTQFIRFETTEGTIGYLQMKPGWLLEIRKVKEEVADVVS